jgi:ABC-2 type transport system ATP-binding protein
VSLTGQFASVDEDLTGHENLVLVSRLFGYGWKAARRRADELLTAFDLDGAASKQVRTYSGGMRRRLDVAASLVVTPEVLFLDEPTTGLDPRSRNQVWDIVRSIAGEGTTVLLTTQYLDEADRLADRLAVIDHGRLIATGTPFDLTRGTGHSTIRLVVTEPFPAGAPESLQQALGPLTEVHAINEQSLLITGPADATTLATVSSWCEAHGVLPESLSLGQRTLEDVFLQLTGRELSA